MDLLLSPGESVAVLGPNGAGKSTLLRMLATLLRPGAGELRVAGHPCPAHAAAARARIGYLGHDPLVYRDLTARENLELYAALYDLPGAAGRVAAALARVGLAARSFDPVRTFSRGMAQRLGIARLVLHEPELLLLDEPHAGLDAPGRRLLDDVVAEARASGGVVLVTHEIDRALALADRLIVLRAGRVVEARATAGLDAASFRARYEGLTG